MVGGILYWHSRRLSPTKDTSTASEVDRKSAPEQSNGLVETDANLQEHERGYETNNVQGASTASEVNRESAPEQSNGLVETDADLQEHEHGCETNKEEGTSTAADIEEESAA